MSCYTPGPWEFSTFTKPDGSAVTTVDDVAETVAHSARAGERTELFGVSLQVKDETGRHVVVCYTGNGPNAHNNARAIAALPALVAACRLWDQGFAEGEQFTQEQLLAWMNANRRAAREALAMVDA